MSQINQEELEDFLELKDDTFTDWHSKNTIIFGSLIEDGYDWGRDEWEELVFSATPEAVEFHKNRINKLIEKRFMLREIGMVPFGAFRNYLQVAVAEIFNIQGPAYQKVYEGYSFNLSNSDSEVRRKINSDYPQSMLREKDNDYASTGEEEAVERSSSSEDLARNLELGKLIGSLDANVLDHVKKCFSSIYSFGI